MEKGNLLDFDQQSRKNLFLQRNQTSRCHLKAAFGFVKADRFDNLDPLIVAWYEEHRIQPQVQHLLTVLVLTAAGRASRRNLIIFCALDTRKRAMGKSWFMRIECRNRSPVVAQFSRFWNLPRPAAKISLHEVELISILWPFISRYLAGVGKDSRLRLQELF